MTAFDPSNYTPNRALAAKIKRRLTQWRCVKPMAATPPQGLVTFTFDDFPKSAAQHGADALGAINASGTYYTCTGLMQRDTIMGEMFSVKDIENVLSAGHEIGTHTETHLDCAQADTDTVLQELATNTDNLQTLSETPPAAHFAWPYGETHVSGKTALRDRVATARGILPGINRKGSDLMQLRSMELTRDARTAERAARAIEDVAEHGGWLIIFTHDVQDNPSPYGTTPEAFLSLTRRARDSGAAVLNMSDAFQHLNEVTA